MKKNAPPVKKSPMPKKAEKKEGVAKKGKDDDGEKVKPSKAKKDSGND